MPKLICSNEACEYEIYIPQINITKNGINEFCAICGNRMIVQVASTPSDINFDRFSSMSDVEKKRVLKQRSQAHFNQFDKKMVEEKRAQRIQEMKDSLKNDI